MLYIKRVKKSNILMVYTGPYSTSYQHRNVKVNLHILGKGMLGTSQKGHGRGKIWAKPAWKTSTGIPCFLKAHTRPLPFYEDLQ